MRSFSMCDTLMATSTGITVPTAAAEGVATPLRAWAASARPSSVEFTLTGNLPRRRTRGRPAEARCDRETPQAAPAPAHASLAERSVQQVERRRAQRAIPPLPGKDCAGVAASRGGGQGRLAVQRRFQRKGLERLGGD